MLSVVWHYWLGSILLIVGVLAPIATAAGYVAKVSALKYPNRRRRAAQNK